MMTTRYVCAAACLGLLAACPAREDRPQRAADAAPVRADANPPSAADAATPASADASAPVVADASPASDPDAGPSPDAPPTGAITIPDPGTGPADWQMDYHENFTPGDAFPVGIVTDNYPYILAYIEPTSGDVFYVFRTGPTFTRLDIDLWGNKADVLAMHVHEGTGLVFGAEVPDDKPEILLGGWNLQADTVYVLEIHTAGGGFV